MGKSPGNSEIPPGTVSAVNPEAAGILQLSPEDELIVQEYAKQKGIPQAEAVRQLLDYSSRRVEQEKAKPSVMGRTLEVVQQAQELGVASSDPNDVINSMGRGVVIKSLAKGLEGEDNERKGGVSMSDLKEMYYLRIMGGMAGINDNGGGAVSSAVQEMKAQNEKLIQEMKDRDEKHEQRIKEMEDKQKAEKEKSETDKRFEKLENLMLEIKNGGGGQKSSEVDKLIQEMRDKDAKHKEEMDKMKSDIRDMVFEKKILDIEKNAATGQEAIKQDIKTLNDKIDLVGRIPQTAGAPKDGVSELEEIGGKITRIKSALEPIFPHVNAPAAAAGSTLSPVPTTPLKNPDGSTDYIAAAERLGTIVVKGLEAINKEKPPKANVTGGAQQAQQQVEEKRMSPEEYANYLLSLPTRTAEQDQWLTNYKAYLEREYMKLAPAPPQQPVQQVAPAGCSICGNPIYKDGLCGKCWADINVPVEKKEEPTKQAEPPTLTWEQAEEQYAQLLQKGQWTIEETAWVNLFEKKKKDLLAQQQAAQAEVPVKAYTPPVGTVQPVQSEPVAVVEAPPVETVNPEPVPQIPAEQPQEVQPEVQAEVQPAAEPQTLQQEEEPADSTVAQMREEEEARARALKGFI